VNRDLDSRGVEVNAYPCHRIDRETSGLVIFAKGKAMQTLMMARFKERSVKKTYIAFVHGNVREDRGTIRKAIYNNKKKRNEDAVTKFRVMERMKGFTVLETQPVTGRTNQIRIHFKKVGHPLVGESVYAFRKDFELKFKRAALHAMRLEFAHPVTGEQLNLEAPLPEDMRDFIDKTGGKR
jgi:23S rRNA pseudouridine1911/1915/1917 synthase